MTGKKDLGRQSKKCRKKILLAKGFSDYVRKGYLLLFLQISEEKAFILVMFSNKIEREERWEISKAN